jgi:hypothetical protein
MVETHSEFFVWPYTKYGASKAPENVTSIASKVDVFGS